MKANVVGFNYIFSLYDCIGFLSPLFAIWANLWSPDQIEDEESEDEDVIDLASLDRTWNHVRTPLAMQKNIYVALE